MSRKIFASCDGMKPRMGCREDKMKPFLGLFYLQANGTIVASPMGSPRLFHATPSMTSCAKESVTNLAQIRSMLQSPLDVEPSIIALYFRIG